MKKKFLGILILSTLIGILFLQDTSSNISKPKPFVYACQCNSCGAGMCGPDGSCGCVRCSDGQGYQNVGCAPAPGNTAAPAPTSGSACKDGYYSCTGPGGCSGTLYRNSQCQETSCNCSNPAPTTNPACQACNCGGCTVPCGSFYCNAGQNYKCISKDNFQYVGTCQASPTPKSGGATSTPKPQSSPEPTPNEVCLDQPNGIYCTCTKTGGFCYGPGNCANYEECKPITPTVSSATPYKSSLPIVNIGSNVQIKIYLPSVGKANTQGKTSILSSTSTGIAPNSQSQLGLRVTTIPPTTETISYLTLNDTNLSALLIDPTTGESYQLVEIPIQLKVPADLVQSITSIHADIFTTTGYSPTSQPIPFCNTTPINSSMSVTITDSSEIRGFISVYNSSPIYLKMRCDGAVTMDKVPDKYSPQQLSGFIDQWNQGSISPLEMSLYLSELSHIPRMGWQFCDPLSGGCAPKFN